MCVHVQCIADALSLKYRFKWPFLSPLRLSWCRQAGLCSVGRSFSWLPQSCHTAALCSKTAPSPTRPNSRPFIYIFINVCVTFHVFVFCFFFVIVNVCVVVFTESFLFCFVLGFDKFYACIRQFRFICMGLLIHFEIE